MTVVGEEEWHQTLSLPLHSASPTLIVHTRKVQSISIEMDVLGDTDIQAILGKLHRIRHRLKYRQQSVWLDGKST